ncbi:hypothetical protein Hbut_1210 [Hyperthermus butylicus DSM 5456]|uniref:Uncharacterized protein n=1 Tax=Hyperthermus butylicus (strain DSM 5456 / JCM 9403 / PLM1-5) TaxID=415426 RepID=A2BM33_HYPBU|nr:hypothetical protein Hbut_1210 [Hyperthermus butylicus DSM 5456]
MPCGKLRDCIDMLAILFAASNLGPIGRPSLSTLIGIGEKRVRNLVAKLRSAGLVKASRAGITSDGMQGVLCLSSGGYTIALAACSRAVAELMLRSIVALRDKLVILTGSPAILEVIGYIDSNGATVFPGLGLELSEKYARLVSEIGSRETCRSVGGCLVAVFNLPDCYRCCASFLQALAMSG